MYLAVNKLLKLLDYCEIKKEKKGVYVIVNRHVFDYL